MSLLDRVFTVCRNLVGKGWDELLSDSYGLNIDQPDKSSLKRELSRPLRRKKQVPGFEDFVETGIAGLVAGSPAHSLLYHALASPNVLTKTDGSRLEGFPTLAEIEAVENYVFGLQPPSLEELSARAGVETLTIVVFAYEYRPAAQTCHGRHADMAYSRTGVARVGTVPPSYHPELRGFLPDSADPFDIAVSPSRFAPYLAVQRQGDKTAFLPMRFRSKKGPDDPENWVPDGRRNFWVPIHKLFSGRECLRGLDLKISLSTTHVNEKIHRIHKVLDQTPRTTPPYRFTEGIAEFSRDSEHGAGTLVPEPHRRLVEPAELPNGKPLTFQVPPGTTTFSSFDLGGRSGPEYVHIRTEIREDQEINLNDLDETTLMKQLGAGNYKALQYVDFTGDGWIAVDCPQLKRAAGVSAKPLPAYSLVTAPDFFPSCDQRELMEWTGSVGVPPALRGQIWNVVPDTLCDVRLAANIQLPKSPFDADDETMTAVVGLDGPAPSGAPLVTVDAQRHSHLPDDAAGVFAPGWDVGQDTVKVNGVKTDHLAAYRLGSPFPEDAKLCAALSTFWPAVAPDATREMEPSKGNESGTVSPMTDQEIGQIGDLPWDGVLGPQVVRDGDEEFAEFASFQHVDYVRNALNRKFTSRLTARVDASEYERRIMALALAYLALGTERVPKRTAPVLIRKFRNDGIVRRDSEACFWKLLSFQVAPRGIPELQQAQLDAQTVLPSAFVYRLELFPVAVLTNGEPSEGPVIRAPDIHKKRIRITERFILFVDPETRLALLRSDRRPKWRPWSLSPGSTVIH
jgi:hypothetical protein